MKLQDAITNWVFTGICDIDPVRAAKCLGKTGYIYHHSGSNQWRLVNTRAGVKVTISEEHAKKVIQLAGLKPIQHPLFVHVTTYER